MGATTLIDPRLVQLIMTTDWPNLQGKIRSLWEQIEKILGDNH